MRRAKHAKVFLLILLVTISGCFPASYTYWAPKSQGGRLFLNSVSSVAPKDHIEFLFDGARAQFCGNGTGVGMSLYLSDGQNVSFLSDTAEFQLPESAKIKFEVTSVDAATLKQVRFSPIDTLTGNVVFVTDIGFGGSERPKYRIKMPRIKVNDRTYEIPEIEFTKTEGFGISFGIPGP